MVDAEKILTRQRITAWFERAQIDYSDLYVREYIAYNAWFREVTHCSEDHIAIRQILRRFVMWDDYIGGRVLTALRPVVEQIVSFTHNNSVQSVGMAWNGVVKDTGDWRGLIYFWYQTRCDLFHGLTLPGEVRQGTQIKLAYESLNIFMSEIIRRMEYCFNDADFARLTEIRSLLHSKHGIVPELQQIEAGLYQKFIHSPDIWNVDMERVQNRSLKE